MTSMTTMTVTMTSQAEEPNDYGYVHDEPSSSFANSDSDDVIMKDDDTSLHSTGDVTKYGYGDATPDSETAAAAIAAAIPERKAPPQRTRSTGTIRQNRRSSMKKGAASRRSSVGYTGEMTVQLPGRSRPVRRRTSISFSNQDLVCEVMPAKEMTEAQNLWFSDEESLAIREKCLFLVELMRAAESNPTAKEAMQNYNTRGLEVHVEPGPSAEQGQAWYSVFLEQHLQRNEGNFNADTISQAYQQNTWCSQQNALERAKQDAIEIEGYTSSTRRQLKRYSSM